MTLADVTLRPAERREREGAACLLAQAFVHDPLIAAATSTTQHPQDAREAVFRAAIVGTLNAGGELVLAERAGTVIGAALIADPQVRTLARPMWARVARLISGARFLTLARHLAPGALTLLNDADLASRRLAPPHPHHVLVAVGVTESARDLGVGRLLVDHTLQRARQDSRSWGVRLETENPGNAELYARWGFTLLGVVPVAQCEVHVMAQAGTPDGENDEVR